MGYNDYGNGHGHNNGGGFERRDNRNEPVDLSIRDVNGQILSFNGSWITKEADEAMIAYAEAAGKKMSQRRGKLSTSKIRNIFGEIKRIQVSGYDNNKSSFYLLKPKVAYAVGRERKSNFGKTEGIETFQQIYLDAAKYVTDTKSYQNFCNLMEALVAYHKANGGD